MTSLALAESLPYVDDDIESQATTSANIQTDDADKPSAPDSPFLKHLQSARDGAKCVLTFLKPFIIAAIYSMIGGAIFIACERDLNIETKRIDLDGRNVARARFLYDMHQVIYRLLHFTMMLLSFS